MYVIKGNIFIFSSKKEHWRTWLTITVTNTPAFYHLFKTGMQILSSCAFLSGNDTVQTPFYYLQFAPEKIGPDKKETKRKNKVLILFLLTTHSRFHKRMFIRNILRAGWHNVLMPWRGLRGHPGRPAVLDWIEA